MTLIQAGAVALGDQLCRPGWLHIDDGRIAGCGAGPAPSHADAVFPEALVVPGFVDIHCHGGGGASYADADGIDRAAAFHRQHGTTTTLASLVTDTPSGLLASVGALAAAARAGTIRGIHLEGPWLSTARCGAHAADLLRHPDLGEIEALLTAADGSIRMVTLAPELPGADAAIRRLTKAGVVVAVGHTDASYEQTQHALSLGATVGTHLFNAMPPVHHREPGPVPALIGDREVTVELIADGVHLHSAVIDMVVAAAGPARIAAITDATPAAGLDDGPSRLGSLEVSVTDGVARIRGTSTIAGSTATMDQIFRALAANRSDAELLAATRMTSTTPARALGLPGIGVLRPGFAADLVVLQEDLRVAAVMRAGRWVRSR